VSPFAARRPVVPSSLLSASYETRKKLKMSRFLAILAVVCLTFTGVALAGNSYTYLTYYSDSKCNNFVASRGLTDQNFPYFSATASTCQQEMQCLLASESQQCADIAVTAKQIRILPVSSTQIDEIVDNNAAERLQLGGCTESNSFSNCYFSYFSTDQVEDFFEE
jgi:hypothetical protein